MALHKAEHHCDPQRDLRDDLSVLKSPHCRLKLTQQGKAAPFLAYPTSSRSLMGQSRTCICVCRTNRSAHFLSFTKRCDTNSDYLMLTKEISKKSSHKNITKSLKLTKIAEILILNSSCMQPAFNVTSSNVIKCYESTNISAWGLRSRKKMQQYLRYLFWKGKAMTNK